MKRLLFASIFCLFGIVAMAQSSHYLYVYDRTGWTNLYVYSYRNSNKAFHGDWPGALPLNTKVVNGVPCKVYEYPITSAGRFRLIFNDGNGNQLADYKAEEVRDYYLTVSADGVEEGFYMYDVDNATPLPTNDFVVYQANEKIFATNNAFAAIQSRLTEIKDLGVNVLWLMPIHPIGEVNTANSPYCVRDFKAIHPNFGTLQDLIQLVDSAHALGMRVILDWVANHCAWDNQAYIDHPDWFTEPVADEKSWHDVACFDYEQPAVHSFMIDNMLYWIHNADIDGFRCDYAQGVSDEFWQKASDSIRSYKPNAILLAESSRKQLYLNGFDWLYSWDYLSAIQNLYSGTATLNNLYTTSDAELNITPASRERLRYITNHDACSEKANSALYTNANGMLSAACLTYFLEGVPLIYSSQEIGYLNKIPFCVTPSASVKMNWNSNPTCLAAIKQLMRAYHQSLLLRGGERTLYRTNPNVACFTFDSEAGTLLVIANTTNSSQSLSVPTTLIGHTMQNLLTEQDETLAATLSLSGYEYYVFAESMSTTPTATDNFSASFSGTKHLQNGQIIIEKNNERYTILGIKLY